MITIIAKFQITSSKEVFLNVMKDLIKRSLAEEGCIEYSLFSNPKDDMNFVLIERWKDEKAVEFHNKSLHFNTMVPQLNKVATVDISIYNEVSL